MSKTNSLKILGVYGLPGSGKSVAADIFQELGAGIIALDEIGHEMLESTDVKMSIKRVFGKNVFSSHGVISREALAEVVFSNPKQLEKLNAIIHPAMINEVKSIIKEVSRGNEFRVVVIEGALLIKMGLDELCDTVIRIETQKDLRHERLIATRNWSQEDCDLRDSAQAESYDEAVKLSDIRLLKQRDEAQAESTSNQSAANKEIVIENSTTPEALRQSIINLWEEIA